MTLLIRRHESACRGIAERHAGCRALQLDGQDRRGTSSPILQGDLHHLKGPSYVRRSLCLACCLWCCQALLLRIHSPG